MTSMSQSKTMVERGFVTHFLLSHVVLKGGNVLALFLKKLITTY